MAGGRSGQIARALRLARSTTHRILSVLVELGLLRLDPASHQYFLDAGVPTVRVSTDHDSPISVDRFVPGEPMPLAGSAAGALQCAWSAAARAACTLNGVASRDGESGFPAAELRAVRRQGYYAAATACHTGARLGVPLLLNEEYVGCVIMRCLPETIAAPRDCRDWADSLKRLAASIIEDSAAAPGAPA